MKNYLHHIKSNRTPHERRQHATQVAAVVTGAVFVVWLTTLGVRLASQTPTVASDTSGNNPNQTMLAGVAADSGQNMLEVATSSGQ